MPVTAVDIKRALSIRHGADFFTTECMSGPSGQGVFRFDAVAIAKSWTKPTITGYEVKVTRSDFKADNKFYAYLPYFHELYIACPKGMIKREELPESIGLIWYNPETGAVRAKKRAPYRNIEIDPEMLLHIFYSHMRSDRLPFFGNNRLDFCRRYLEEKSEMRGIGDRLGTTMAKKIDEQNRMLKRYAHSAGDLKVIKTVEEILNKHGIYYWSQENLAEALDTALSRSYPQDLDRIRDRMKRTLEQLDQICDRKESENEKIQG